MTIVDRQQIAPHDPGREDAAARTEGMRELSGAVVAMSLY